MAFTTYIDIDGLRIQARHGVLERERLIGNLFEVSLRLAYDATAAMDSDNIGSALNYAEAVATVREVMEVPSALLEHVAGRLHTALMTRFPQITSGRITIAKLHPPISTPMRSVSFTLEW